MNVMDSTKRLGFIERQIFLNTSDFSGDIRNYNEMS